MADPSFDITSKVEKSELVNAVTQALTEITNRFDFKGS
ncbi:MAG: nucleotide-binding protein, partial [Leptospira sp.]|nr:nucleotide-binding protein [Leptospira sp.]